LFWKHKIQGNQRKGYYKRGIAWAKKDFSSLDPGSDLLLHPYLAFEKVGIVREYTSFFLR